MPGKYFKYNYCYIWGERDGERIREMERKIGRERERDDIYMNLFNPRQVRAFYHTVNVTFI